MQQFDFNPNFPRQVIYRWYPPEDDGHTSPHTLFENWQLQYEWVKMQLEGFESRDYLLHFTSAYIQLCFHDKGKAALFKLGLPNA